MGSEGLAGVKRERGVEGVKRGRVSPRGGARERRRETGRARGTEREEGIEGTEREEEIKGTEREEGIESRESEEGIEGASGEVPERGGRVHPPLRGEDLATFEAAVRAREGGGTGEG